MRTALAVLSTTWILAACGTTQIPSAKLVEAKADVRAARAVRADENPQAAMYLRLAQDKIDRAEGLIMDENYPAASSMLERAEADAELATAIAQEEAVRQRAEQAQERLRTLQSQLPQGRGSQPEPVERQ